MTRRRVRPRTAGLGLGLVLVGLVAASLSTGAAEADVWGGLTSLLGGEAEGGDRAATVVLLRLRRTIVAIGVGAALAYSGALLQGLFRNALADPSVIGISAGATLGASAAILIVGGYGQAMAVDRTVELAPLMVTVFAFLGAFGVALLVAGLATRGGRLSVPTLLLSGVAVNACAGGMLTALQAFALSDNFELAKAMFSWSFGSLQDHSSTRIAVVLVGLAVAGVALPLVARELDLFAGGEEDAEALGVDTARVKLVVLAAASLAAAAAVSVAGQIAFVGLIVPHLIRLLVGPSHRPLLPLALLGGATLLCAADVGQRLLADVVVLQPGVLMSLVGGPFFLVLLARSRKELSTW